MQDNTGKNHPMQVVHVYFLDIYKEKTGGARGSPE